MKDKIMDLIKELAHLEEPYILETLTSIFESKKELFMADTTITLPEKYTSFWFVLRNVYSDLATWQQLASEQQKNASLQLEISSLSEQLKHIKSQINHVNEEQLQRKRYFTTISRALFEDYNAYLLSQNPLIATMVPTTSQQQQHVLNNYLKILQDQINKLIFDTARLHLGTLILKRKELSIRLKQLHVIVTDSFADAPLIYEKLKELNHRLVNLKEGIDKAQQELAENISTNDIRQEIKNKTQLIEKAKAELLSIEVKIDRHELSPDIKTMLTSDYAMADDKENFIAESQNSLSWSSSLFNLHSWYSWGTDTEYKAKLSRSHAEFYFLQLLHQQEELNTYIQQLTKQLVSTQDLLGTSSSTTKPSIDLALLQQHTLQLLKEYNPDYKPDEVTNVSLLTAIINTIGPLSKCIDETEESLHLLVQLMQIDSAILELRTTNTLTDETDALMPKPEELSQLRITEVTRQQEIERLQEKIKVCTASSSNLATMIELTNKHELLRKEKGELDTKLKQKKAKQPQAANRNSLETKIEQIKHSIQLQIIHLDTELKALATKSEDPLISEQTVNKQVTKLMDYQNNLHTWNCLIGNNIEHFSNQLLNWYQQLFITLQMHVTDEISYYQACQLLRDIYFEVEASKKSKDFTVLANYQTLCPTPQTTWQCLTSLKPGFPLLQEGNKLTDVQNPVLETHLKGLYQQQQLLRKDYPREGQLLLQAIYNLHQGCLLYEMNPKHPALTSLLCSLEDPRYEILHSHRGFHKVFEWIAKLCSFLIDLIKHPQEKSNSRQFFFFKPTKTIQLLQDATMELGKHAKPLEVSPT
ncbi:hypothetical protein A8135_02555 [Legionella jamestowniensis]|uniref:Interaptin n=1 Tax=Legionella jamestowniensis TaxID=455 RepID=A0ABX2XTH3_9GAMM|nr:hypothetical protein [Legionella jamestowniensis]OCH97737.1 hypothetical protein A8135_02555 [Legionella jamestowniensis]